MRPFLLGALLLLLVLTGHGQSPWEWGLRGGVLLGGPIPTELDPDSSSGKMAVGPSAGAFLARKLAARWQVQAGLSYAFKGATYEQIFRNDTMMPLEIFPGVTDTVPTYYYADVQGRMALHYLDLPVQVLWKLAGNIWVQGGLYASALLGGKDAGDARIQIGDGQLFPDTTTTFDNVDEIRRLDYGFTLGGQFRFAPGLFIELQGLRSLRSLYREGFFSRQGLPETKLYHTQFFAGLGWRF